MEKRWPEHWTLLLPSVPCRRKRLEVESSLRVFSPASWKPRNRCQRPNDIWLWAVGLQVFYLLSSENHTREKWLWSLRQALTSLGANTLQVCPTFHQRDRATNHRTLYHINFLVPEILSMPVSSPPSAHVYLTQLTRDEHFFPEPFVVNINTSLRNYSDHLQCMYV